MTPAGRPRTPRKGGAGSPPSALPPAELTLDEIVARKRHEFTESHGAPVTLTAEEWNTLAHAVTLADHLEWVLDAPHDATTCRSARDTLRRLRAGR